MCIHTQAQETGGGVSAYVHTCIHAHTGPGGEEHGAMRGSHGADVAPTAEQPGDRRTRRQETGIK